MFGRPRKPKVVPEQTIIRKVTDPREPGRQLGVARRAVKMQDYFVQRIGGQILTLETCVEAIAHAEGWEDNRTRVSLILQAAEKLKVNR